MATTSTLADNYFELSGQVALVTGASSGLGRHFATILAHAGCTVVATARREERLQALRDKINQDTDIAGSLHPYTLDVTEPDNINAVLQSVATDLGPVAVLVNNAGIGKTSFFLDADDKTTNEVIETNQQAVWQVAQRCAQQMVEHHVTGSIINIASVLGLRVLTGAASYAVSKAAVIQMTKVMALELARYNIRANAIAPGYFSTEMNSEFLDSDAGQKILKRAPMRRHGELSELDGILLLLASTRSRYMTGTVIPVDGGHTISSL